MLRHKALKSAIDNNNIESVSSIYNLKGIATTLTYDESLGISLTSFHYAAMLLHYEICGILVDEIEMEDLNIITSDGILLTDILIYNYLEEHTSVEDKVKIETLFSKILHKKSLL